MNCCENFPSAYRGKTVEEIPELAQKVREVKTDYKAWITHFCCSNCNQMWEERYEVTGHGEIPIVSKVTTP